MKLRLDKNSIRLRLKKSDLDKLKEQKAIHEIVAFPSGKFKYSLIINETSKANANIQNQGIEVVIP